MQRYKYREVSAAAVLELVGREAEMQRIADEIAQPRTQPLVVFLIGQGGIGKTRLLKEALCKQRTDVETLDDTILVDFYHMQLHAVDEFIEALYDTLPHAVESDIAFERYEYYAAQAQLEQTANARLRLLHMAREAFVAELRALSQRITIVLGLDTLERLVYYDAGDSTRTNIEWALAWQWLLETLPSWGQVVLLMAGREASESLYNQLSQTGGLTTIKIRLEALDEAQSWEYLHKTADYCAAHDQEQASRVIREKLLKEPVVFRPLVYKYTRGRPIFLSLMVDYLSRAQDRDIQTLINNLRGDLEIATWEKMLIQRLLGEVTDGDVIKFLGYLPKGANVDLLAAVMGFQPNEIAPKLEDIRQFSFVKPTSDGRFFLHDELYDLFKRRQVLERSGAGPEAERVEAGVRQYYKVHLQNVSAQIKDFYRIIEGGQRLEVQEPLVELTTFYQQLLTDDVFYRLREDPTKGFRRWYRYVHQATHSANPALDIWLELEMLTYLMQLESGEQSDEDALPDGEFVRLIKCMLALGPIRRAWAAEDYVGVIGLSDEIRRQRQELFAGDPTLETPLQIWKAKAMVWRSQDQAIAILDETIAALQSFEEMDIPEDDARIWLAKVHLGFAYRTRGYARRVQGLMEEAVLNYTRALALFDQTNLRIEIAFTLNDKGFAEAQIGDYENAISDAEDALERRYALGDGVYIGLSLNTLASIHTLQGDYDEALNYSQRALNLFRALKHRRGEGLALNALSEAARRRSGSLMPKSRMALLEQALSNASEAHRIFKQLDEVSRRVESLIEIGCAHRDWVQLCNQEKRSRLCRNKETHFKGAEEALEKAASLAKEQQILYRQIDALVNLAWLNYFDNRLDEIDTYTRRVQDDTPRYWFDPATGQPGLSPTDPAAQQSVWTQIAKLHVVRGHTALKRSATLPDDQRASLLRAAGQAYALAINYDLLFGAEHFGIEKARRDIREHLNQLRSDEAALGQVCQGIWETEAAYGFQPEASQFLRDSDLWCGS